MTLRSAAAVSALALLAFPDASPGAPHRIQELMERARANSASHPAHIDSQSEMPQYGTQSVRVNVGAYGFQGANSAGDQFVDDGNGYRFLVSTVSGGYMASPVQVPAGAMIDDLGVNFCDGGTGDLTVALYDGRAFGSPAEILGSVTTVSTPGCYIDSTEIAHLYDDARDHPLYIVIHWEGPMDGSLKFNDAFVDYHLAVSPAPATATFADVPTTHPFFQFVEALAASGITAGCGNGNFCPDQPLTRGQMAVFLSKALGLNWPN